MLMDATVPQLDGFRFVYVLPLAADRVLVEDTYFSDTPALDHDLVPPAPSSYAAALAGRDPVAREESGVLPHAVASVSAAAAPGRAARRRLPGGWFHPVTGYSFPIAARLAELIAGCRPTSCSAPGWPSSPRASAGSRVLPRLNRLLFRWFTPSQRTTCWSASTGCPRRPSAASTRSISARAIPPAYARTPAARHVPARATGGRSDAGNIDAAATTGGRPPPPAGLHAGTGGAGSLLDPIAERFRELPGPGADPGPGDPRGDAGAGGSAPALAEALLDPAAEVLSRPGKGCAAGCSRRLDAAGGAPGSMPPELPAVVELLHAGSLVVDDIEDGSDERRGAPALHHLVGTPLALNTGNWLSSGPCTCSVRSTARRDRRPRLSPVSAALVRCHQGRRWIWPLRIAELARREVPGWWR